jgi:hypothetical protein
MPKVNAGNLLLLAAGSPQGDSCLSVAKGCHASPPAGSRFRQGVRILRDAGHSFLAPRVPGCVKALRGAQP